jgi:hypothetical protein
MFEFDHEADFDIVIQQTRDIAYGPSGDQYLRRGIGGH